MNTQITFNGRGLTPLEVELVRHALLLLGDYKAYAERIAELLKLLNREPEKI